MSLSLYRYSSRSRVALLATSLLVLSIGHAKTLKAAAVAGDEAGFTNRPNIIVILADDLGYSDLGCYGGEISTPNIDRLASGGARFTQFYNSARCCPSRASLMTGVYPSQAGIGDFTTNKPHPTRGPGYLGRLNEQCVTLAEVLGRAGYGTYYVGKWHLHPETGPIRRGFDEFFGYTRGHSHDQYDADYYIRLPEERGKEIDTAVDDFYATDVFNDYAMEFIRQGQASDQPWFLFLGHSSPHFPVQAPAGRADKYDEVYARGWDELRTARFKRMQEIGLIDGSAWNLTPRSLVPVDREDIANGYSGQANPAWDSLPQERQNDLARRMSVFAAMVESVDTGVGRIVDHLESTDDLDNTLIVFLSDNGACYEWGPFGFDGTSRRGTNILRDGTRLRETGGPGTHQSYGSGWANLGNTPFRMYKHFTHEGGISTPAIFHWPARFGNADRWVRQPAHVMDLMPTLIEATGSKYPARFQDREILPYEGVSLLPMIAGRDLPQRALGFDHESAHALRMGDWKLVWSKRSPNPLKWELYRLSDDRCETIDLASRYPERVAAMSAAWREWADRVQVDYPKLENQINNRPLVIEASVEGENLHGVVLAQGGNQQGIALHFENSSPVFEVRIDGKTTRLVGNKVDRKSVSIVASLNSTSMSLMVDGQEELFRPSPGLLAKQPIDPLSRGRDERSSVGSYEAPNAFKGRVIEATLSALSTSEPQATGDASTMFLLPYFLGNGETGIYLTGSKDGIHFDWLNQGEPIIEAPKWPGENLTRDPSLLFHDGEYHMVWTTDWSSRSIGYARSVDLTSWSEPQKIDVWGERSDALNTWAPELHWDPDQREFLILWSSPIQSELNDNDGTGNPHDLDHRSYAVRTRDFIEFSEPELFYSPQEPELSVIDPFIAHDDRNTKSTDDDRWIMVIKNEMYAEDGGKNLSLVTSSKMQGPYSTTLGPPLVGAGTTIVDEMGEGPSLLKYNGEWRLYWDAPGSRFSYCLATSTDLRNWKNRSEELRLPAKKMRHGTVLLVPKHSVGFSPMPKHDQ